jgi:hypothetical protein
MASDIVFDQEGGDSISIQGVRVLVTGRINLPQLQGANPPADGEIGDLVMTIEDRAPQLGGGAVTAHLWLCVPHAVAAVPTASWREVQLGDMVFGS